MNVPIPHHPPAYELWLNQHPNVHAALIALAMLLQVLLVLWACRRGPRERS